MILRGGRGAPNYDAEGSTPRWSMLRAAGLPERVVIDASHDNSGKDPAKQIVAAGEIGEQIAAGNGAIVGVMLESFLVEGRQDLGDGEPLTYGQSITDACIDWETTVSVLDRLAACGPRRGAADEDRRPRRRPDRRLDRARRAASGSSAEVVGFDPDPATLRARGRAGRDRPRRRLDRARPATGAEVVFCAAPVGGAGRAGRARRSRPAGPRRVVTDVGSTKREHRRRARRRRALHRRPPAGRRRDRRGRERPRRPLRGRPLVPDARPSAPAASSTTACSGPSPALGARPQAIDADAHDRLMATVSHLPHVVANVLVGQAAAELTRDSERMPEVGPSFRDTTRVAGANPAIWGDIFASNREAVAEAVDAVGAPPAARRPS